MSNSDQKQILYMEDDPGLARLVQKRLNREGHEVDLVTNGAQGLIICRETSYDVVIVDQQMPGMEGIEVIRALMQCANPPAILMLTGQGNERIAVEAMKLGASDYMIKDTESRYLDILPAVVWQLLHQREMEEEHQRMKLALEYRQNFERLLFKLSTQFINCPLSKIDQELNQALQSVGNFAGAERSYVFQFRETGKFIDNTHEWCARGITSQKQIFQSFDLDTQTPWVAASLNKNNVICIDSVNDLPPEAKAERSLLQECGIKSIILVPMMLRTKLLGFVGFDFVTDEKDCTDDLVSLLRMVGEIVMNALEHKRYEKALRTSEELFKTMSITDQLTSLFNMRHFMEQIEAEMVRAERYKSPLSLIMLDVDNFKTYNDTFGHVEGDQVLRELGSIIRSSLRVTDSAYRYGGEEFTVLLPNTDAEMARTVAERIRKAFAEAVFYPDSEKKEQRTISLGIAEYVSGERITDIVDRADQHMYRAKKKGKNRTCM
ncbi:diguanylate cyclase (GGDEF) domain-containing protein [Maridesulfovibrio ferrireducens]|uniref:diguanylate cyclase n=1 Tax=Maridesulfovibrio ferrireducens TaxID=246191 RepID=A0A1G9KQR5_9BACT|nr:diguanylate cyclase [Maridesulfovibrio ferrireducens]SDL51999.1 diguanylate cyclase (GGDEF) domain-containing protein [Maridesulfovibrio ferrireducens]